MSKNNFVSGGITEWWIPHCSDCRFLRHGKDRDGGWCTNPSNRVPPRSGWPNGFEPSVSSTGGCDLYEKETL